MSRVYIRDATNNQPLAGVVLIQTLGPAMLIPYFRQDPIENPYVFVRPVMGETVDPENEVSSRIWNAQEWVRLGVSDQDGLAECSWEGLSDNFIVCDYSGRGVGMFTYDTSRGQDIVVWIPHNLVTGFRATGLWASTLPDSDRFPRLSTQLVSSANSWAVVAGLRPPNLSASPSGEGTAATTLVPLIDVVQTWDDLYSAIVNAQTRVWIASLALFASWRLAGRGTFALAIETLCRRVSSIDIKILLYENSLPVASAWQPRRVSGDGTPSDEQALFSEMIFTYSQITLMYYHAPLYAQLHSKFFIVDNKVYIIGTPPMGYWSEQGHASDQWHDVSCRVTNPSVTNMFSESFVELWNSRLDPNHISTTNSAAPYPGYERRYTRIAAPRFETNPADAGNEVVDFVKTSGLRNLKHRTVAEAYARAFVEARRYIYLENQYLYSPAIVSALTKVLERDENLQVIILTNPQSDLARSPEITRAMHRVLMAGRAGTRVGIFTLWSATRNESTHQIDVKNVYVHSKVAIVDDHWCTIGSANLNPISIEASLDVAWDPRYTDCAEEANITILNQSDTECSAKSLRQRLWSEYGVAAVGQAISNPLRLWNERSAWAAEGFRPTADGSTSLLPPGINTVCFPLQWPAATRWTTPRSYVEALASALTPSAPNLSGSFSFLVPRTENGRTTTSSVFPQSPGSNVGGLFGEELQELDQFFVNTRSGTPLPRLWIRSRR